MIDSIHKEFIRMLETTPWMDSVTRNSAIEKAKAMNFYIGCPNELTDNAKLDEYYQNLELQPHSLLHSMLRIRKFNKNKEISEFRQPIEKSDWRRLSIEATMVNAFYSPQLNIISKFQKGDQIHIRSEYLKQFIFILCAELTAGLIQDRFYSDLR